MRFKVYEIARKEEFRKLLPLVGTAVPTLRRGRHGRRAGGGRVVHHVVLKLAGVGLGVVGLAHCHTTFGTGQAAPVTEATLETGLKLSSLVVLVGFGEVRVSVVPPVVAKEVAPAAPATPAA